MKLINKLVYLVYAILRFLLIDILHLKFLSKPLSKVYHLIKFMS